MLLFSVGFFSAMSANADTMYTDYHQCTTVYSTQINRAPLDQQNTSDYKNSTLAWCQQHMTAANLMVGKCVEEKLQAIANDSNTTVDAVRAANTAKATTDCGGTTSVATTTTGTGTAATGSSACAPSDIDCITREAANAQLKASQTAAQQKAAADAAAQQAAQQQAQPQQQGSSGPNLGSMISPLMQMATNSGSGSGSGSSATPSPSNSSTYDLPPAGSANSNSQTSYATPWAQSFAQQAKLDGAPAETPDPLAPLPDAAQVQAAQVGGQQQMDDAIKNLDPKLQAPATDAQNKVKEGENAASPPTGITANAKRGTANLNNRADQDLEQLRTNLCQPILKENPKLVFGQALGQFEKYLGDASKEKDGCAAVSSFKNAGSGSNDNSVQTPLAKFNKGRDSECAPAAEKAEKLCVESDSMKAVRTLMDLAGPVMLAMNAAKKTCGAMGDITKFAGGALTAANAVCMAVKMKCESTCKKVITQLTTDFKDIRSSVMGAAQKDAQALNDFCNKTYSTPEMATQKETCLTTASTRVKAVAQGLTDKLGDVDKVIAAEQEPQYSGSVPNMDALCKDKMRNIVGLASNIGAIALSMASAKKCEKDLATAAAQGNNTAANVSTQAYCSAAETKDTQFCKCQGNSTAQGCATAALASSNANAPADQRGVDLKNFGGASGFAGAGNLGSAAAGSYHGYGTDGSGVDQTGQALLGGSSTPANGAATSALGSGAIPTGPDGKVDAKTSAAKADDKKWSFGSFANSIGSAFGFGQKGSDANGAISAPPKTAIERKIASDRYTAEVSPSTGADNFSKIKRSYVRKGDTFMAAP